MLQFFDFGYLGFFAFWFAGGFLFNPSLEFACGRDREALAQGPSLPAERALQGGEKHSYPLNLKEHDLLNLKVTQKGIDVTVRLLGQDGAKVTEVNDAKATQGAESLLLMVEQAGLYTLEIESAQKEAPTGTYEINLAPIRTVTKQEQAQFEIKNLNEDVERLRRAGKFDDALGKAQQAVAKSEQVFGSESVLLADSLNLLGVVYRSKGNFPQAEQTYLRALLMREKVLGPDHLDVAITLNNLAVLYRNLGEYAKAEPLYLRSLAIREKLLGKEHPTVAANLNNLGLLYKTQGDYVKAEALYQRALAIREKVFPAHNPVIAESLSNLAALYHAKGDFQKAEPLYLRALAIDEKALGEHHPDVASDLNNLAQTYLGQKELAKAEPYFVRSLGILERTLGKSHPLVASSLNNLASLYLEQGQFLKAEPLLMQALAIDEKLLGPNHPEVASDCRSLARVYSEKNDFSQAESLLLRSTAIYAKTLGDSHPELAQTLFRLAQVHLKKGERAQAVTSLRRANEVCERELNRNLVAGSERQKLLFLNRTAPQTDVTLSLLAQPEKATPEALQAGLTVVLRRKGRALDAMAQSLEILRSRALPADQELLGALAKTKEQLSGLILKGPGRGDVEKYRAEVKQLEEKVEQLEVSVSARSIEYRAQFQPVTLESIQNRIPAQTWLVEFISYRPYQVADSTFEAARFGVFALNGKGEIHWADLGPAKLIDQKVAALREALGNRKKFPAQAVKRLSRHLSNAVLQPLYPWLKTSRHLLISPDGSLNLIPFAALLDEKGRYLVESYRLTNLTSGRDLLRLAVKIPSKEPPLVLAGPNYGNGAGPNLLGQTFAPLAELPGARQEGLQVQALFPNSRLKIETEASETVLKQINQPELVHIATHGFFLSGGTDRSASGATRNLTKLEETGDVEQWLISAGNPLLRSWLFFAGANSGGTADNDGTLTALEASQLNLWGTKLVVLSACDTGLGEIKDGEGVYGLQRALVLAGSESQMMTLWPVSDRASQELMVAYYTRLKNGVGRSEALRQVQLALLKNPRRQHPFFWAGFVQSGEWANLQGVR
ncbi:MAG: CHAT domain-containing protein [Blastocatellia bacterium]|nr:CHAT domain-containing protein [Blastocatellia bacterium]